MTFSIDNKQIYFRCDFGGLIGYGHLSRSLALAEVFKNNGHEPIFISRKRPSCSDVQLPYKILWLKEDVDVTSTDFETWKVGTMEDEARDILSLSLKNSIIIIDHYALGKSFQKILKARGWKILLFQDVYSEDFEVDILINYNLLAKSNYSESFIKLSKNLFLLGPDYAPLNLEYVKKHHLRFNPDNNVLNVGIYLGGVNISILKKLANAIAEIKFFEDKHIEWIVNSLEEKKLLESLFSSNIKIHIRLKSLIPLYERVQLFIGACGVSFLERACMGLWQINFQVADNQKEIAAGAGNCFDIRNRNVEDVVCFIRSCLNDSPESILRTVLYYFNIVPGDGAENVYKALKNQWSEK